MQRARVRQLNPEEAALWARVARTALPLPNKAHPLPVSYVHPPKPAVLRSQPMQTVNLIRPLPPLKVTHDKATLDSKWDKTLSRGSVVPDSSIDLHGHNLHSAYVLLDEGLERSIGRGDRVLLLITGKPPQPDSQQPHKRGAIRAAVVGWLAGSRHADRIAAVRAAHPRHGGNGALYIIIRRRPVR